MTGIIYKCTIIAGATYKDHKPFYIGQHWSKSTESFLKGSIYFGSGSIWRDCKRGVKKKYGLKYRNLIRREILYSSDKITQAGLDALEKHFIIKEKSHYSHGIGGCNIIIGSANNFGHGSPSKDKLVRLKMSKSRKGKHCGKDHHMFGKTWDEETKRRNSESNKGKQKGEKHWNYGKHRSEEVKRKIGDANRGKQSWLGLRHTEETKRKLSEINKGKIHTDETRLKMSESRMGNVWVNNGKVTRFIKPIDVPKGWVKGRLPLNKRNET